MRPILCLAAVALAAAPPPAPEPLTQAPAAPQSRVALCGPWMAYSATDTDGFQLVARQSATSSGTLVTIFRAPKGHIVFASACSPDGRRLYFETNVRAVPVVGRDDSDVWIVDRDGDAWGRARPLGTPWDSPYNEHAPTVDTQGTLCINSARPDGVGDNDLYCGTIAGSPPRLLAQVNSPEQDAFPTLAAAGDALVFASNRPGGLGGWDLYVTWRRGETWSPPHNLGAPTNSTADELNPTLAPEGGRLVFVRRSGDGPAATRQMLVTPFSPRPLPAQD